MLADGITAREIVARLTAEGVSQSTNVAEFGWPEYEVAAPMWRREPFYSGNSGTVMGTRILVRLAMRL